MTIPRAFLTLPSPPQACVRQPGRTVRSLGGRVSRLTVSVAQAPPPSPPPPPTALRRSSSNISPSVLTRSLWLACAPASTAKPPSRARHRLRARPYQSCGARPQAQARDSCLTQHKATGYPRGHHVLLGLVDIICRAQIRRCFTATRPRNAARLQSPLTVTMGLPSRLPVTSTPS